MYRNCRAAAAHSRIEVRGFEQAAQRLGITGVPFFVVDRRLGVSGAQPPEVLAEVKPYEAQFGHAIPVFVAGGIYTGADMAHYTKRGAAGVQLATRFIRRPTGS